MILDIVAVALVFATYIIYTAVAVVDDVVYAFVAAAVIVVAFIVVVFDAGDAFVCQCCHCCCDKMDHGSWLLPRDNPRCVCYCLIIVTSYGDCTWSHRFVFLRSYCIGFVEYWCLRC